MHYSTKRVPYIISLIFPLGHLDDVDKLAVAARSIIIFTMKSYSFHCNCLMTESCNIFITSLVLTHYTYSIPLVFQV